jgi:demethylmenaquinone methyltransferase/2-methoxy-6-polyprenyl-1,4-benzoquinol methylase
MFSGIAHRYDLANRVLSFSQDGRWRKRLVELAAPRPGERLLDVATGTGEIAIAFAHAEPHLQVTGLDLSAGMLERARQKLRRLELVQHVALVEGDALALPFPKDFFDIITIGFGLRNLPDRQRGILEMTRVLRAGGRLLILEFSLPPRPLWRAVYLFYLKKILPTWGRLLSGARGPYEYLRDSILAFPDCVTIKKMMQAQGLEPISLHKLGGGLATIYLGYKTKSPNASATKPRSPRRQLR